MVRVKAELAMQGAYQSTHRNQRRGDQHGANGDLHGQKHFACREAAADNAGRPCFHDFVGIRLQHLSDRDCAEEESAEEGEQQSDDVNRRVRGHG